MMSTGKGVIIFVAALIIAAVMFNMYFASQRKSKNNFKYHWKEYISAFVIKNNGSHADTSHYPGLLEVKNNSDFFLDSVKVFLEESHNVSDTVFILRNIPANSLSVVELKVKTHKWLRHQEITGVWSKDFTYEKKKK